MEVRPCSTSILYHILLRDFHAFDDEGDLIEQSVKWHKSSQERVKYLKSGFKYDPLASVLPSLRMSLRNLIQSREDGWHRRARLALEEVRSAVFGWIPFNRQLSDDAGIGFENAVGRRFLAEVRHVVSDPSRISLHLARAELAHIRSESLGTFTATISAL